MAKFRESERASKLLKSSPSMLLRFDPGALDAFMQWTIEVHKTSEDFELAYFLNQLSRELKTQHGSMILMDVSTWQPKTIEGLIQWIEKARPSLSEKAVPVLETLATYRDQVQQYRDRLVNYWM